MTSTRSTRGRPSPPGSAGNDGFLVGESFLCLLRDVVGYINTLEDKRRRFSTWAYCYRSIRKASCHKEISTWVQSIFGEMVIRTPMVLTNVLQNIGIELQTAYESEITRVIVAPSVVH